MAAVARAVAVVFGGPSPEHDVSILTGLLAGRTLRASSPELAVHLLYWSKNGSWFSVPAESEALAFADGVPKGAEPLELLLGPDGGFVQQKGRLVGSRHRLHLDVAIVCCHGGPGEDGTLQGALDLAGIAYSGPSASSAALGMDKLASGAVIAGGGLPTLPRLLLHSGAIEPSFSAPYIVKPRFGGSSIGIEVVEDFTTALARLERNVHLRRGAVLEPYRPDLFDLQVAMRTYPALELSAIERPWRGRGEILGYGDKYVAGVGMDGARSEIPAALPAGLTERLKSYAEEAALLLGARGVARIDFLSDGEQLFVNEINTVPGSLSRHMFVSPPLAFAELLSGLVREATERPAAQFSSAGADGAVLKDAGSIAGKLG